jgi:hypothetical protein
MFADPAHKWERKDHRSSRNGTQSILEVATNIINDDS